MISLKFEACSWAIGSSQSYNVSMESTEATCHAHRQRSGNNRMLVEKRTGAWITNATWRCRKPISQWQHSSQMRAVLPLANWLPPSRTASDRSCNTGSMVGVTESLSSDRYFLPIFIIGHVSLVVITGTTVLVPYLWYASLQVICRSGTVDLINVCPISIWDAGTRVNCITSYQDKTEMASHMIGRHAQWKKKCCLPYIK